MPFAIGLLSSLASAGGFHGVEPPDVGADAFLSAVSISPVDGAWWAVGRSQLDNTSAPLLAVWDGAWTDLDGPTGPFAFNWLSDVAARADGTWVIGASAKPDLTRIVPLASWWDGSELVDTVVPDVAFDTHIWYAIDGASGDDAWAVGEAYDGVGSADRAVAWHWDGAAWTSFEVPDAGDAQRLYDVAVVAPDDAWAVGVVYQGSKGRPFVVHWDGAAWTEVPTSGADSLASISASGPDDVWAVGIHEVKYPKSLRFMAVAVHWDGATWSAVPMEQPGKKANVLNSVVAVSPTEAWAVGRWDAGADASTVLADSLVEHWDGAQWKVVPSENVDPLSNDLLGVDALGGRDVVAVGADGDPANPDTEPLVLAP